MTRLFESDLVEGVKWYLVFLGSTTCHEAAHAWAAARLGDPTAERQGLATLDPTPHLRRSPAGMVAVPLLAWFFGGTMLGWASVPLGAAWAAAFPRRAALVAAAGPAANLVIALIAALLIHVGLEWHWFLQGSSWSRAAMVTSSVPGWADFGAAFLSITVSLNLLLAAFNLLPLPPLDGASLPAILLPARAAAGFNQFVNHPTMRWVGLIIAWQLFGVLFEPVRTSVVRFLGLGV
jgi:Zn-dependent protease